MNSNLQQYAQLIGKMEKIQDELATITAALRDEVVEHGTMMGYGYRAHMKPGRKRTDHEAAALGAGVTDEIIEAHSTTKTTVAWAQITKAAGVDVAAFTKQDPPSFVVEAL